MESRETRKTKAARQLTEAEEEILNAQRRDKDVQLREQAESLEQRREDFEIYKATEQRALETIHVNLSGRERDMDKRELTLEERERKLEASIEALKENTELKREISRLRTIGITEVPPVHPNVTRYHDTSTIYPFHDPWSEPAAPRVSFREALENVPHYDGHNISLSQFIRACRRAKEIVPPSCERNLTRLLSNKLRGRAYSAIEDEPCETVTQLTDLLNGVFGSPKTLEQYRGELYLTHLKPEEHILDYITRIKDLRTSITDAERRQYGPVTSAKINEIDALVARAFCHGLPLEYRLQLSPEHHLRPFEAFTRAKEIAKQIEYDKERFEPRRIERPQEKYRVHPIGRPLAQSTPTRNDRWAPEPRRYAEPPNRSNSRNDRWTPEQRRYVDSHDRARPTTFDRTPTRHDYTPRRAPSPTRRIETGNNRDRYPAANTERGEKSCRYCKNRGHEIEECRKRQYNNAQRDSGNSPRPSRETDEPRAGPSKTSDRPVRVITTETKETLASQS